MAPFSPAILIQKYSFRRTCFVQNISFAVHAYSMISLLQPYFLQSTPFVCPAYSLASLSQACLIKKHFSCMPWFGQSIPFIGPDYSIASFSQALLIHSHPFLLLLQSISFTFPDHSKEFPPLVLLCTRHSFRSPSFAIHFAGLSL